MNKASERYYAKVEIPISVILETIFSDDNKDVETLCRWAKHYGYVDLIKENGDKPGYYKLQDDYIKQSFYVLLDKEERKQYDYEDYLLDELQKKDNEINDLKSSIADYQEAVGDYQDELKRKDNNWNELKNYVDKLYESETYHSMGEVLDKINELEENK